MRDGPARPPAPVGGSAIRFDDVAFAYPGARRPALDGVALAIPAGATVAIVGPSGAGKTTLANLLLRFWDPADGRILIDGVDLREFELDHLRRRISLVSQDTYLFNDTLRANVAAGPARRRRGGDPRARSTRRRSPISSRACPRGSTPGSASAACNCRAGSASASRSPAPF